MKERERREIGFLAVIFVRFGVGVVERLGVREGENFARPKFFSWVFAHLSRI